MNSYFSFLPLLFKIVANESEPVASLAKIELVKKVEFRPDPRITELESAFLQYPQCTCISIKN